MRPRANLMVNKEFVYALLVVVILVFGLFFLNYHFDISASSFTVREAKDSGGSEFFDNLDEKFEDLKDDVSETFKNSISP